MNEKGIVQYVMALVIAIALAFMTGVLCACGETSTTEPMVYDGGETTMVETICHVTVSATDTSGMVATDTIKISPCVSAYYLGVKGWFDMDCKFHAFTDSVSFVCGMDGLPSSSSMGPPADLLNADTTTNN